jgi:hypothetical protein
MLGDDELAPKKSGYGVACRRLLALHDPPGQSGGQDGRLAEQADLDHSDRMAKPAPGTSLALPADQAEPIATLKDLRQRTGDRALLGSYQAAIDRLDALAYRLSEVGAKPAPAPKPVSAPSTPHVNRHGNDGEWADDDADQHHQHGLLHGPQ